VDFNLGMNYYIHQQKNYPPITSNHTNRDSYSPSSIEHPESRLRTYSHRNEIDSSQFDAFHAKYVLADVVDFTHATT